MRRASTQRQSDRREAILEAAQRCFARTGFHPTSMQEICSEAGMSPGGLYRYFPSKEAIIAAIAERDRADAAAQFAAAGESPGFFAALERLARHYLIERSEEEIALCAEIKTESRRNPEIARIHHAINADVEAGFVELLRKAAARGEIATGLDYARVVRVLFALGDGLEWRRATDPNFDVETVFPLVMHVAECLLAGKAHPHGNGGKEQTS